MRARLLLAAASMASAVFPGPPARAATPADQTLVISEADGSYRLSVPVSRVVMTIPRGGLEVVKDPNFGGAASPRYFHLEDKARGIIVSGWFEPAESYKGVESFWKGETDSWKKNHLPKPRNVSIERIDKWDVILYDMKVPDGSNTHVRGEWMDLGTWIDVHISVTTAEPIDRARATAKGVLGGIRISQAP